MDWVDDPDSRVDIVRTALADLKGVARLLAAGPVARFMGIGVLSTLAYAVLFLALRPLLGAAGANAAALADHRGRQHRRQPPAHVRVRGRDAADPPPRARRRRVRAHARAHERRARRRARPRRPGASSSRVLVAASLTATVTRYVALQDVGLHARRRYHAITDHRLAARGSLPGVSAHTNSQGFIEHDEDQGHRHQHRAHALAASCRRSLRPARPGPRQYGPARDAGPPRARRKRPGRLAGLLRGGARTARLRRRDGARGQRRLRPHGAADLLAQRPRAERQRPRRLPGGRPRSDVDAFHAAALAAGARDNGAPGVRPQYHPHYYGAFVLDPDGNNAEAVCHTPGMITRGFHRRRTSTDERLPPGQYLEHDFPVLSAGPTPHTPLERVGLRDHAAPIDSERTWTWDELQALPREEITVDIHCVTTWTKLDTQLDRGLRRHAARRRRAAGRLRHRAVRRRLHDEPAGRGRHRRQGLGRLRLRRRRRSSPSTAAPRACSSRTCTSGRARSGCGG